jgi:hypothetical protein
MNPAVHSPAAQLPLPWLEVAAMAPLSVEMRRRIYAQAARIREALLATSSPYQMSQLSVRYVLYSAWDEERDNFALAVMGPKRQSLWLTTRLLHAATSQQQRYPFRLWGRVAARLQRCELTDACEHDPLVECDVLAFVAADFRLGSTVLTATHRAPHAKPLFVSARTPIPGWPQ